MRVNVTPFDITLYNSVGDVLISWVPEDFHGNTELVMKVIYLVSLALTDEATLW